MESKYHILMDFIYNDIKYVIYTDDTYNESGSFNLYTAGVDPSGNFFEPTDTDVDIVFKAMIDEYKRKIIEGEI